MYKGTYLIGIYSYDKYELCETILESTKEFMEYAEIDLNTASAILSKVFHHKTEYIIINGKKKNIEFLNTREFD